MNVLAYADDLVVLSPSRTGLEELVQRCERFAMSRDIKFNTKNLYACSSIPSGLILSAI